jgi:hypothetical protein
MLNSWLGFVGFMVHEPPYGVALPIKLAEMLEFSCDVFGSATRLPTTGVLRISGQVSAASAAAMPVAYLMLNGTHWP